jgi:hypothetical protein
MTAGFGRDQRPSNRTSIIKLGRKSGFDAHRVNLELCHHFSKNIVLAQAAIRAGKTLVSSVAYDQDTASARVNGKDPFLVSLVVETNDLAP